MRRRSSRATYDVHAPKRPVNVSLNEDLVRCAQALTNDLSAQIEALLAAYIDAENARRNARKDELDAAIAAWNEFDAEQGAFADEHAEL